MLRKPEVRRLQEIKGGSFTITLPKDWVKAAKLGKGSDIVVAEDGFALKLFPAISRERLVAVIDMEKFPDMKSVKYCIWTYYMQGAEKIVMKSMDVMSPEEKRGLKNVRLELPGIDVVDEDPHGMTFGVTVEAGRFILDELVRRMANFAIETHKDAIGALISGSRELANEVVERGGEITRHYRAMIRQIAICSRNPEVLYRSGVKDTRELITYALLARDLSRTVNHAIYIAKHVQALDGTRVGKSLAQLYKAMSDRALQMQQLSIESFLEKSFKKVIRVSGMMEGIRQLEKDINLKILRSVRKVEIAASLILLAREIRRIAGYSVAMADVAANRILAPEQPLTGS